MNHFKYGFDNAPEWFIDLFKTGKAKWITWKLGSMYKEVPLLVNSNIVIEPGMIVSCGFFGNIEVYSLVKSSTSIDRKFDELDMK